MKPSMTPTNTVLLFGLWCSLFCLPITAMAARPVRAAKTKKANVPKVLSLAQVYRLLHQKNWDLKILKKRLVQAEITRSRAWTFLLPVIQGVGSYTYNNSTAFAAQQQAGQVFLQQHQYSASLQLNWKVVNFQNIPLLRIAYMSEKQFKYSAHQIRRESFFAAARAYYSVLLAEGMVRISRKTLKNTNTHYRQALERYKAKLTTRVDVMRARLDYTKAHNSLQNSQIGLSKARLALALLLGLESFPWAVTRPPTPQLPAKTQRQLLKLAQTQRAELKGKKLAVKIAKAQLTQSWMKALPTLSVTGNVNISNAPAQLPEPSFTQWTMGVTLTIPLFQAGRIIMDVKTKTNQLQQVRLDFKKLQQSVRNETKTSLLDWKNARLNVSNAREQWKLAQATYKLNQQRYKAGVASAVAMSDANTQLFSTSIQFLREQLNQDLATLNLLRVIGSLKTR